MCGDISGSGDVGVGGVGVGDGARVVPYLPPPTVHLRLAGGGCTAWARQWWNR